MSPSSVRTIEDFVEVIGAVGAAFRSAASSCKDNSPIRGRVAGWDKGNVRKLSRNAPCKCGSGRKSKWCCRYALAASEKS